MYFFAMVQSVSNLTRLEADAMAYARENLYVIDDAVALIRGRPRVYAGDARVPSGWPQRWPVTCCNLV
jgi:hypothetical protein